MNFRSNTQVKQQAEKKNMYTNEDNCTGKYSFILYQV